MPSSCPPPTPAVVTVVTASGFRIHPTHVTGSLCDTSLTSLLPTNASPTALPFPPPDLGTPSAPPVGTPFAGTPAASVSMARSQTITSPSSDPAATTFGFCG